MFFPLQVQALNGLAHLMGIISESKFEKNGMISMGADFCDCIDDDETKTTMTPMTRWRYFISILDFLIYYTLHIQSRLHSLSKNGIENIIRTCAQ